MLDDKAEWESLGEDAVINRVNALSEDQTAFLSPGGR
jgi:hypothetical protein